VTEKGEPDASVDGPLELLKIEIPIISVAVTKANCTDFFIKQVFNISVGLVNW
jgi:hypothetical protein